jgi:Domain of unknown function (DUF4760)
MLGLKENKEAYAIDTFITLVIALGGIATGIGAIWAAMLARRQAQLTERSLAEQRQFLKEQNEIARNQAQLTERSLTEQHQSFQEQTEIARHQAEVTERSFAEQNKRARLALEVDMLLKFFERFQGKGLSLSETRRSAAKHIKDNFFVANGDLLEVDHLNKAGEDVLNFFELMGLLVRAATIDERLVQEMFSFRLVRYWQLCKPAVERAREDDQSPGLWENFEHLANRMIALAKEEDGGMFADGFTKTQLRRFVEEEAVAGLEDGKEA